MCQTPVPNPHDVTYYGTPVVGGPYNSTIAWCVGKFIQLIPSDRSVIALDDMGEVWEYQPEKKAWFGFPSKRIPFIPQEESDDDEE